MIRVAKTLVFSVLLLALGFAAGTVYGFWNGLGAGLLLDSTPKGVLAASNLKAMDAENYKPIRLLLETDVNQALASYSLQQQSWWYPAFKNGYLLIDPDANRDYIRRIANYRMSHPFSIDEKMFDHVPPEKYAFKSEYQDMAIGMREYKHRVEEAVKLYADK
ncbi:hypothetical protein [Undibacterium sp. Di24W]|uniref:hypothetical protein n=1 Tax=Undibacterium sp. Di24W TaxID=3413033 RepID=UPI003BF19EF0